MFVKVQTAIAEIGLFIPLFILVVFVAFRRRSIKQLQWILLSLACLVRIISAALKVGSIQTKDDIPNNAKKLVMVDNVVLCLFLLTNLQFLIGINKSTSPTYLHERSLKFLHVPSIVATLLCIIGATYLSSDDESKLSEGGSLVHAGWLIFLMEYLILAALTVILISDHRRYWSERHVLIALVIAIPFLAIRFIQIFVAEFTDLGFFYFFTDTKYLNPVVWLVVWLFMSVGMEVTVVALYTVPGLMPPRMRSWKSEDQLLPLRGESLDGR